jgi:hypothetical protein
MPLATVLQLLLTIATLVVVPAGRADPATGDDCLDATEPAQPATEPVIFGDLDKNRNNYWDKEEVKHFDSITSIWTELDSDGNDRVSRNEFNEYLHDSGPILLSKQQIRSLIMSDAMGGCDF